VADTIVSTALECSSTPAHRAIDLRQKLEPNIKEGAAPSTPFNHFSSGMVRPNRHGARIVHSWLITGSQGLSHVITEHAERSVPAQRSPQPGVGVADGELACYSTGISAVEFTAMAEVPKYTFVDNSRPPCSKCARPLMLTRVEPEDHGFDLRIYYCAACAATETVIAAVSRQLPRAGKSPIADLLGGPR
jgi:hypothetical protein